MASVHPRIGPVVQGDDSVIGQVNSLQTQLNAIYGPTGNLMASELTLEDNVDSTGKGARISSNSSGISGGAIRNGDVIFELVMSGEGTVPSTSTSNAGGIVSQATGDWSTLGNRPSKLVIQSGTDELTATVASSVTLRSNQSNTVPNTITATAPWLICQSSTAFSDTPQLVIGGTTTAIAGQNVVYVTGSGSTTITLGSYTLASSAFILVQPTSNVSLPPGWTVTVSNKSSGTVSCQLTVAPTNILAGGWATFVNMAGAFVVTASSPPPSPPPSTASPFAAMWNAGNVVVNNGDVRAIPFSVGTPSTYRNSAATFSIFTGDGTIQVQETALVASPVLILNATMNVSLDTVTPLTANLLWQFTLGGIGIGQVMKQASGNEQSIYSGNFNATVLLTTAQVLAVQATGPWNFQLGITNNGDRVGVVPVSWTMEIIPAGQ